MGGVGGPRAERRAGSGPAAAVGAGGVMAAGGGHRLPHVTAGGEGGGGGLRFGTGSAGEAARAIIAPSRARRRGTGARGVGGGLRPSAEALPPAGSGRGQRVADGFGVGVVRAARPGMPGVRPADGLPLLLGNGWAGGPPLSRA